MIRLISGDRHKMITELKGRISTHLNVTGAGGVSNFERHDRHETFRPRNSRYLNTDIQQLIP